MHISNLPPIHDEIQVTSQAINISDLCRQNGQFLVQCQAGDWWTSEPLTFIKLVRVVNSPGFCSSCGRRRSTCSACCAPGKEEEEGQSEEHDELPRPPPPPLADAASASLNKLSASAGRGRGCSACRTPPVRCDHFQHIDSTNTAYTPPHPPPQLPLQIEPQHFSKK